MNADLNNNSTEVAVPDSFEKARNAFSVVQDHLGNLSDVGTNKLIKEKLNQDTKSFTNAASGDKNPEDLPVGPGLSYMTHLFRHNNVGAKLKNKQAKDNKTKGNIYTDQMEALKTALNSMGIYSEKNPGGMPVDIKDAKNIWFGDKPVEGIQEAEWRTSIEQGDSKIDPKKVRKFVNYDGSLTWEILNDDKTVMSRFTMGEYGGQKIFAQGGYKKFAELLNQVKEKQGPAAGGEFNSIRDMFGS